MIDAIHSSKDSNNHAEKRGIPDAAPPKSLRKYFYVPLGGENKPVTPFPETVIGKALQNASPVLAALTAIFCLGADQRFCALGRLLPG